MKKIRNIIIILVVVLMLSSCGVKNTPKQNNNQVSHTEVENTNGTFELNKSENDFVKTETETAESAPGYNDTAPPVQEETKTDVQETEKETDTSSKKRICTISVRCDEILSNLDRLDKSKYNLIPEDGVIYFSENVEFCEGESVFDILLREMKNNKIHLEFEYTPVYESSYVEGIGNIYEFDCGSMSGWVYKVNGIAASCGSSQYLVKENDVIEWIYSL